MEGAFLIRTFGCQMNEHDSERIAGLLEADGMTPTNEVDRAGVVVLNTCAIRENADNKLYGNLGHLKPVKAANPALRIIVSGCLAQKDRGEIQRRAPWVDVVVGTHALPQLLELLERSQTEGPQMDVREATETFPSGLPAARRDDFRAWVSIAPGCDNACTFCIVPLVRGPQRSRSIGDVLAEVQGLAARGVVEITLLGQNVNTYGRDVTVPGSARRPLFAELLRRVGDVEGIRRVRFTSPHPHDFTPDVIDAMAGSPAVCEHIHFPLQSGSDEVLRRMRRSYRRDRYLAWLERIRAAIPEIAVSTDVIVGFPGESDGDFGQTLEVVESAGFDSAYMFQYSPRPGTQAAGFEEQVPKEVVQERFDRLVALQERISLERAEATVGRTVEVLTEGAGRKGEATQSRTRTNRIVHLPDRLPPGEFVQARIVAAAPHHLTGELMREPAGAAPLRERMGRAAPLLALVGPTASGKTDAAIRLAGPLGAEICSVDSMLVYRGMDVGTAKPSAAQRRAVPHHLIDLVDPTERFTVARFQAEARAAIDGVRTRGATPLLVGGSGLYFRAVVDELRFPGEDPAIRTALEHEAAATGATLLYRRLASLDPEAAAKIEPDDVRRIVRALEVAALTGTPFSGFAEAWARFDPSVVRVAGVRLDGETLVARVRDRVSAMFAAGWVEEVEGLLARGSGPWLTSTQAIGYSELVRHLDGRLSLEEAWESTVRRTKNLARRQMAWFRRDPRVRWFDAGEAGAAEVADDVLAFLELDD